jgi:cytidylate kinase
MSVKLKRLKMIITIDGPVATGKSSIARKLAEEIGFIFFDTGAMYRAVTYGILKNNIDIHNAEQLEAFLKNFQLDIRIMHRERHYFVEDEDVTAKIRGEAVTTAVSEVAAIAAVREKLVALQREHSVGVNAVFEGRDMGSVVFPDAHIKVFLTGRNDVRAKRRFDELKKKYPEDSKDLTLEKCLEEINKRDNYDSTREHSPLIQAKDALVIDTSDLTIEEIVFKILEYKDTRKTKLETS